MASTFKNAWRNALEIEKGLLQCLREKEPTFAEVAYFLTDLRAACLNAIFQDFEAARAADVEGRLWDVHLKASRRFRKLLGRFREESGKRKRPVERRKVEKHYLEFIKSSQRFYRGYIQQLSSHFGGIAELDKVAKRFSSDSLSVQSPVEATSDLRRHILQSCHATLIRLGDLSRYRETELVSQDRNWGPAIGYYDLASVIYPASGASHNQQAVIALADGNHLKAIYHLYMALATQEPHPTAKGNLEIEFRKVISAWTKGELIRSEDAGIPGRSLAPWFVYFHARCYKGADFVGHEELESEVLNQLAVDVKERSLETTLQKFCLINIAAENFAQIRSREESVFNACVFFQRINVKTFFTLLQVLSTEVERLAVEEPSGQDAKAGADKITVVVRRVLPALRHYSSWLLTARDLLVAYKEKDTPLSVQITEFWKIYANALTLLASTFDIVRLPEVDYLLEEDEETLGFTPLVKSVTSRRFLDGNGKQKPRMRDIGVERSHPNVEMLYRIREFVIDGLDLVVGNRIPVVLVDDNDKKTFIYSEEGFPAQLFSSPRECHHALSSTSVERRDIQQAVQDSNNAVDAGSTFGGSQSASASISANMHGIVEGVERLVDSDTFETAQSVPEYPPYSKSGAGLATSTKCAFGFSDTSSRDRCGILIPPGLAPLISKEAATGVSSCQAYTPRPSLPGIPSIWNTTVPPLTEELPSHRMPLSANNPTTAPGNAIDASPDLILRQNLLNQSQLRNPCNVSALSPWTTSFSSSAYTIYNLPGAVGWERSGMGSIGSPVEGGDSNRLTSSDLADPSWANNAFLGSTLHSGAASYLSSRSSTTDRRPGRQLGAIGQTPPCGQGG